MSDRDGLTDLRGDRIATTETRLEGFYWVVLGQNPPEIAYWERGEWWLAGDAKQPEAVTVASDRLVVHAAAGVVSRQVRLIIRFFLALAPRFVRRQIFLASARELIARGHCCPVY
jgi:hypothetical protein